MDPVYRIKTLELAHLNGMHLFLMTQVTLVLILQCNQTSSAKNCQFPQQTFLQPYEETLLVYHHQQMVEYTCSVHSQATVITLGVQYRSEFAPLCLFCLCSCSFFFGFGVIFWLLLKYWVFILSFGRVVLQWCSFHVSQRWLLLFLLSVHMSFSCLFMIVSVSASSSLHSGCNWTNAAWSSVLYGSSSVSSIYLFSLLYWDQ